MSDSKFYCERCNFRCNKQSDWNRHILRNKHINLTNNIKNDSENKNFTCKHCNKIYNSRNGLWVHLKKCKNKQTITNNELNNINNEIDHINNEINNLLGKL